MKNGAPTLPRQRRDFMQPYRKDTPAVRALKEALDRHGLRCWLDEEQLRPGRPWQSLLQQGIKGAGGVAVYVGADGLGPWEDEGQQAALQLAVRDGRPVIPMRLPGAPTAPDLPLFLTNRTWIDQRDKINLCGQHFLVNIASAAGLRVQSAGAGIRLIAHTEKCLFEAVGPRLKPSMRNDTWRPQSNHSSK